MSNTKKIVLMSTFVVLLALLAVFNFVFASTSELASANSGPVAEVEDYYSAFRTERNLKRSEEFSELALAIDTYSKDSAEYAAAVARRQELVTRMEDELVMETVIKAIGFSDVAVAITDKNNINVFVNSDEFTGDHATKIFYALEVQYGLRNGNVIIIPVSVES